MKPDTMEWVVNTVVKKLILSHSPSVDREELVSEAYLCAVEKMKDYNESRAGVSTYLYGVIRNHLLNYIRDKSRSTSGECDLDDDLSYDEGVSRDTSITLNQIQERLSERDQQAFQLLREGYTQKEVASIMGVTKRTIGRILNGIRNQYQD